MNVEVKLTTSKSTDELQMECTVFFFKWINNQNQLA